MVTNIQNFKMSAYLHLSCSYNCHWLLPCVLVFSLLYNHAVWFSCQLGQPGDWRLCEDRLTLATYQLLISLTLLAYLNILSDLFTGKMKKLLDRSGVMALGGRIRKVLRCRNNSVSPVEEIDLSDSSVEVNYQETGNCLQNITIVKDHIR